MPEYPRELAEEFRYRFCPMCTNVLRDEIGADGRNRPVCEGCDWVYQPTTPIAGIAVVESDDGLVMLHPRGAPSESPCGLPALFLDLGDTVEAGLVRAVREQTGFEVELTAELDRFLQEGTLRGLAWVFGFRGRVVGGSAIEGGSHGRVAVYPYDTEPTIMTVRLAQRRVFGEYLRRDDRPGVAASAVA